MTALVGTTLAQTDGGAATLNNVTVRGTLNQTSGTLALDNALVLGSGQVIANGTVNAAGTEIQGVTTVNSGGTLATNGTSLYLTGGSRTTVNNGGTLAAAGGTTIELNSALLTNNGTQTGTLDVNYGSTANGSGTFGSVNVNTGGKFGSNSVQAGVEMVGFSTLHLTGGGGLAATAPRVGPQPSAAPGTTNVGSLTLHGGGTFSIRVQNAAGAPGSGYDLTHATGTLTLASDASSSNPIVIALSSLNSNGNPGAAANFDPTGNDSFVLVQADGGILGYQGPGEFDVDTSGFENATDGGTFSVTGQGNDLDLVFTSAVPEPSTWVLLGVGAGLLGLNLRPRAAHRA